MRPSTHHIPSWQPRPCTQHRVIQGINKAGSAKNSFFVFCFFWRGQFSWYYPHKKFQKSLQILPSPTVISFGRREYFFIVQCSLFGSWGLPTCCFQHLPFKGHRKTDGHKNISEAKYTMQSDSWHTAKNDEKNAGRLGWGSAMEAAVLQVNFWRPYQITSATDTNKRLKLEEQVLWKPKLYPSLCALEYEGLLVIKAESLQRLQFWFGGRSNK